MAIAWNESYEKQPQDLSNPGFGAQQIRNDKIAVRERLELEHACGANEETVADVGGVHLEGAGRLFVSQDDGTFDDDAERTTTGSRLDPGNFVNSDLIGRSFVDLNTLSPLPETNEAAIASSNDLARVRTIKTYDVDGNLIDVFDPAKFMSSVLDQLGADAITGIKEFVHKLLLQATGYTDRTTFESYTPGGADYLEAQKELLPREEIDTRDVDAKKHNIFDPNSDYNKDEGIVTSYTWDDPDITSWAGNFRSIEDITCNRLAVSEIRAEAFYGAVYSA